MTDATTTDAPAITIEPVVSSALPAVWPHVLPLIKSALEHSSGERAPADIFLFLSDRQMQLWLALDGARIAGVAVTEITSYPRQKVCNVTIVAGQDAANWLGELDKTLTSWAEQLDCDAITGYGRSGWLKVAARYGYRKQYITMRKSLRGQP